MRDVLTAMIKAHEIQGVIALENSFNRVGLEHVVLVKVASTAVVAQMLGPLPRRHHQMPFPTPGWTARACALPPRAQHGLAQVWAGGDATSRAVRLAVDPPRPGRWAIRRCSPPRPGAFYDVLFRGNPSVSARLRLVRDGKNVLFKISFPAEFHAQTAWRRRSSCIRRSRIVWRDQEN